MPMDLCQTKLVAKLGGFSTDILAGVSECVYVNRRASGQHHLVLAVRTSEATSISQTSIGQVLDALTMHST